MRSLLLLVLLAGCHRDVEREAMAMTGGDPARGAHAIQKFGCGACHSIPGIPGATAKVGPPLDGIAQRVYLAGHLPNAPDNLERWVSHPHAVVPSTVMPEMGVSDAEARDIAAYLYTLR